MSDELPTTWAAERHTLAKHGILKTYLEAWAAILSNAKGIRASELLFVDGFAGPGEYTTGEPGSPIVALNAVLAHTKTLKPVRFVFIEKDADRHRHLSARLDKEKVRITKTSPVRLDDPILGECEAEICKLIARRDAARQPLGPALFFLDQFGYSQVSMRLLGEIMRHPMCETLSYLNCQRLVPYLTDPTKAAGISDAYGDDSWRAAIGLDGDARQRCLIDTYTAAIRKNAGADYVWSFAMFSENGQLLHWLVFSTKNLSGLEHMKKAMWKADKSGGFRFSDRDDPRQQTFFSDMDTDEWHAQELSRRLSGRVMSDDEMNTFVLTQTPFYKYKSAVRWLRRQKRASAVRATADWPVRFE